MPDLTNNSSSSPAKIITLDNLDVYTNYVERKGIDITYAEYQQLTPEEKMGKTYYITDYPGVVNVDASGVIYDNTESGLESENAQDAIDELKELIDQGGGGGGTDTTYTLSVGSGADADKIILTPSTGTPDKVTVPYATSAGDANTVNSHTVASDVPADAVFTDNNTTYGLSVGTGDDANKIVLTPSTGIADKITVPYATNAGTVNGNTVETSVPSDAVFTDTTYEEATTSTSGLMSASDKTKIDGLGTASYRNIPTSGDASTSEVVLGSDSRLTDARNAADVYDWAKAATKPSYTATEVGAIATTSKGANDGVAELDSTGKVPSSQLPSYVDDVLEYNSSSDFPLSGETGKIYIAKDTNKTYRWSGSGYVEISESLALGETSSTAFRGDHGKTAYDHATDSSRLTTTTASGLYKIGVTSEGHVSSATAVQKSDITALGIPAQDTTYSVASNSGIALNGTTFSNSGVRAVGEGTTNGTISVNTNGTTADVAVKGLGSAAYTSSTDYATSEHNHDNTYLKLSGGTMTGMLTTDSGITTKDNLIVQKKDDVEWTNLGTAEPAIIMSGADNKDFKFKFSTYGKNVDVGWNWNTGDGAGAFFRQADAPAAPGAFGFYARQDTTISRDFIGYPDGKLIWDNKRVVTSTDGSTVGNINTPVYIDENGYATPISDYETYSYAPTITIPDAVPSNLADCKVKIEPIQDLHGYEEPWVGGAGKNKLPMTVDGIKAVNTEGTWNGNIYTINGGTFKVLTDSDNNVTGIIADGTFTSESILVIIPFYTSSEAIVLQTNTYKFGCVSDSLSNLNRIRYRDPNGFFAVYNSIVTRTYTENSWIECSVVIDQGTVSNLLFQPMIYLSSETDDTFAPYTNICPISGHTEAVITDAPLVDWEHPTVNDASNLTYVNNVLTVFGSSNYKSVTYTLPIAQKGLQHMTLDASTLQTTSGSTGQVGIIDGETVIYESAAFTSDTHLDFTFTTNSDYVKLKMYGTRGGIVYAASGVAYSNITFNGDLISEPIHRYTVNLNGTVYKGELDVDGGLMTVTHQIVDLGTLTWTKASDQNLFRAPITGIKQQTVTSVAMDAICSHYIVASQQYGSSHVVITGLNWLAGIALWNTDYSTSEELAEGLDGVQFCYPLATPFTVQLTPTQIKLLQGINTLYASTGDISITANGISGSIGALQSNVNELNTKTEVLGDSKEVGYKDIIEIDDGVPVTAKNVSVKIEPQQDLHGYSKPWVGGAGKNIMPLTVAGIKEQNTTGTWNDNVYTINGGTFTVYTDDGGNVTGIKVNGTFSNNTPLALGAIIVPNTDYILSGCPSGGSYNTYRYSVLDGNWGNQKDDTGNGVSFNYSGYGAHTNIVIGSGYNAQNLMFRPMICLASESEPTTFAPYTNICPITGYTEAKVTRTGKNWFNKNNVNYVNAYVPANSGELVAGGQYLSEYSIYLWLPKGTYSFQRIIPSTDVTNKRFRVRRYDNIPQVGDVGDIVANYNNELTGTFTTNKDGYVLIFMFNGQTAWDSRQEVFNSMQIELGSIATTYEPYAGHTYTIDLDGTRYDGTLDVTNGVLTVDRAIITVGDLSFTKYDVTQGTLFRASISNIKTIQSYDITSALCSAYFSTSSNERADGTISQIGNGTSIDIIDNRYSNADDFKTAMGNTQICYELATPLTIQLTPVQVKLLQDYNILYANTGDIKLIYNSINSALGKMQESYDLDLTTDSKEVVGSINELNDQLNGENETYDFAPIITIEDNKIASNLADCKVKVEPIQDLHGYDKPWVGGAGDNKLDTSTVTVGGITFTEDTDGYVSCVDGDGRTWSYANCQYKLTLPSGSYKFVVDTKTVGSTGKGCVFKDSSGNDILSINSANLFAAVGVVAYDFTLSAETSLGAEIKHGGAVARFMIVSSTVANTWQPYTNICPITGSTEALITRNNAQLLPYPYYSASGSTVSGVTYTVNPDTSISVTGTATSGGTFGLNTFNVPRNTDITIRLTGTFSNISGSVNGYDIYGNWLFADTRANPVLVIKSSDYPLLGSITVALKRSVNGPVSGTVYVMVSVNDAPWEPYYADNSYTVQLGDTIYGGTLDVDSGVMTVTHEYVEYDGGDDEIWTMFGGSSASAYAVKKALPHTAKQFTNYPYVISNELETISYLTTWNNYDAFITQDGSTEYNRGFIVCGLRNISTTPEAWKTYLESNPLQVCYELATPFTVQLTPTQIQLLLGTNNLYASTGDISVTTNNGVSKGIESVQEQVNELNIDVIDRFDNVIGWHKNTNLLPMSLNKLKKLNTSGTWNNNVYTLSNVVFTCNLDDNLNITSIKVNGSNSTTSLLKLGYFSGFLKENETYTVTSNVYNVDSSPFLQVQKANDAGHKSIGAPYNFTYTSSGNNQSLVIRLDSNVQADNVEIKPMLFHERSDGTKLDYEPYYPMIGYSVNELLNRVPDAPTTNGTYHLEVTVADGTPTYSWVSNS